MCGIVGFVGSNVKSASLLAALESLEYRGYDSAGLATWSGGHVGLFRTVGATTELASQVPATDVSAAVGHTRWATHGPVCVENAHPHADCAKRFLVVANGIIENHEGLRGYLTARGCVFSSGTDVEVIGHLLERSSGSLAARVTAALSRLEGRFAFVVLDAASGGVVAARAGAPLLAGRCEEGLWVASHVSAFPADVRLFAPLPAGVSDLGCLDDGALTWERYVCEPPLRGRSGEVMAGEVEQTPAAVSAAIGNALASAIRSELGRVRHVQLIGCGSAYHACALAAGPMARALGVRVSADVASSFRDDPARVGARTLVLAVSQSGETADTIAAVEGMAAGGAKLAALVNNVPCALASVCDDVLLLGAGMESAVAATKTFAATTASLLTLAGVDVVDVPGRLDAFLGSLDCAVLDAWAEKLAAAPYAMVMGRGGDELLASEVALKVKEVVALPTDALGAGELKHGSIALVESGVPVVALLTDRQFASSMANALAEVSARGADNLVLSCVPLPGCVLVDEGVAGWLEAHAFCCLVAQRAALLRGLNPDRPRNLAKTVTVE